MVSSYRITKAVTDSDHEYAADMNGLHTFPVGPNIPSLKKSITLTPSQGENFPRNALLIDERSFPGLYAFS